MNFIRGHALNHRQFQVFLEVVDSEFYDLPYHTAVRWLSCGKVLFRSFKLRNEIDLFLTERDRSDPQVSDRSYLAVKAVIFGRHHIPHELIKLGTSGKG